MSHTPRTDAPTAESRPAAAAFALLLTATAALGAGQAAVGTASRPQDEAAATVRRSLPLMQASMDTWIRESSCVSCHHQAG